MHIVGEVKSNILPNLGTGNLATRLMSNPSAAVDGGHKVPAWSELFSHILGAKYHVCEMGKNLTEAYAFLVNNNVGEGEPNVLTERFLIEMEEVVNKLNVISLRFNLNGYEGPARNPQESQDIVLSSAEATEVFTQFLTNNTLTVSRMQEIYTQVYLSNQNQTQVNPVV